MTRKGESVIIRLRSERLGDHVHERVFAGVDQDHLKLLGTLVMDVGEWQTFGAALMLGAERMHGQLVVESPDGQKVVEPHRG